MRRLGLEEEKRRESVLNDAMVVAFGDGIGMKETEDYNLYVGG